MKLPKIITRILMRLVALLALPCALPCVWLSCSGGPTVAVIEVGNPKPEASGMVVDRQTNLPVSNARVSLFLHDNTFSTTAQPVADTITNAEGYYSFDSIPTGTYTLVIVKDTKRSFTDSLRIVSTDSIEIFDTLDLPASASGIVRMQCSDLPTTVSIIVRQTHSIYAIDSTNGNFHIDGLARGRYTIRFASTLDDYSPFDTVLNLSAGQDLVFREPVQIPFHGVARVDSCVALWDTSFLQATVSWKSLDTAKISGYALYRDSGTQSTGLRLLAIIGKGETAFVDEFCAIGQTYTYYIKAIDKNGNAGRFLSAPGTITAVARYLAVKTFAANSVRCDNDFSPISVCDGQIYLVNSASGTPTVTAFDTAGAVVRQVPIGSLVMPWNLKVTDSTLYIGDYAPNLYPTDGEKTIGVIKKFSLDGTYKDTVSIKRSIENLAAPFSGGDFIIQPSGNLFFTNSGMAIKYRANGTIAATRYPSDVLLSYASRLGMCNGSVVTVSGYKTFSQEYPFCQISLLDTAKLTVKVKNDFEWWCQAFAVDQVRGLIYVVADKSTVYVLSEELVVLSKFTVPASIYYDIAVDEKDGSVVLFDGKSVLRYRKK